MNVLAALAFGLAAGLRTVTPEAVYFGLHGGGAWRIVFPLAAIGEYVGDLLPNVPARTEIGPLLARCASGAVMGWIAARFPGAVAGVLCALAGAFGGLRMRTSLMRSIGAIPAALLEDALAIGLAFGGMAALRLI
ncbi:MAG TPA: hypothetical protein VFL13_15570 [Candidatus Baltobacteraceae bacterium]|nr:hypothetical protein [Candidatus Baltobacteraceae bacterium]